MEAIGKKKLKELRNFMEREKIDVILFVGTDVNVRYFSGFIGSCILAITPFERILISNSLDFNRALNQADVERVISIKEFDHSYGKALEKAIGRVKKVGIIKSCFSLRLYEEIKSRIKVKFVDVENFIAQLRSKKLRREIKFLEKSAKISNSGIKLLEEIIGEIAKGRRIRESEIAERIETCLKEKGSEDLAFETIVASGKRSIFPHPYPQTSNNWVGRFGYVDFGAVYRGYCSDVTVPFVIGEIGRKQKLIVETTMEAYKLAIASIEPGIPTWKIYEKIRSFLEEKGFDLKHSLGHGLGLTVHDYPSISPKPSDKILLRRWKEMKFEDGMVMAVEPGIYEKTIGCRIENDVLLTRRKLKLLTRSSLIEV